jgi:hypothetical protein
MPTRVSKEVIRIMNLLTKLTIWLLIVGSLSLIATVVMPLVVRL